MNTITKFALVAVLLSCPVLTSCGDNTKCFFGGLNVSPKTATVDHSAVAPANAQQFLAFGTNLPSGCATTAANLTNVTWSVSDTANVNISNVQGLTLATCVGATAGPVTVTATLPADQNSGHQVTGTATLTCR